MKIESQDRGKTDIRGKVIISLRNVRKSFATKGKKTAVLRGINLDIFEGELLMIYGPSGCGKSTLLNILVGLEKIDDGTVTFNGVDLAKLSEDERSLFRKKNIGIMNQQQYWISSLPVIDNVALPSQLAGVSQIFARKDAEKMLEMVGMTNRKEFHPRELSSGEQQKISLARALITNPKVILCDEPTGNLDINSGIDLMNHLVSLKNEGSTIVMVTHNPDYFTYADRIIFLLDGTIRKEVIPSKQSNQQIRKEFSEEMKNYINSRRTEADTETVAVSRVPSARNNRISDEKRPSLLLSLGSSIVDFWLYLFRIVSFLLNRVFLIIREKTALGRDSSPLSNDYRRYRQWGASIRNEEILDLSFRNIMHKRVRTLITMGAMGVGIGFVIFLTSIGYGLQNLIVSRIATVEDMRQIEISAPPSSNLVITKEEISRIASIGEVKKVLPIFSIASQINFDESTSYVVAYGVQPDYVENSAVHLLQGRFFQPEDSSDEEAADSSDYLPEVVLNDELVRMLGIPPEELIGAEIELAYIPLGINEEKENQENGNQSESDMTTALRHSIVGIISDENPPVVYVPARNIMLLGISDFSQAIILLKNSEREASSSARKTIEAMGYETRSTFDTISQIDHAFRLINRILFTLGLVALSVAVLGIINTLSISQLERTHEVGLMKTIGMQSREIRFLFVSEAMLISILGGFMGVLVGYCESKLLSVILSAISVFRGEGLISVTTVPWFLVVVAIFIAAFIGFVTGQYPSRRAVSMSALDALRYE